MWESEKGEFGAEECYVLEVMWNTAGTLNNLQEGDRDTTRKYSGHDSGQKARLCWQHPFQSIHNSYSSVSWEPYSLAVQFKGLCPHRKRHVDVTDGSIESHCWHPSDQGAIFRRCEQRGKLPQEVLRWTNRNHISISWYISLIKPPVVNSFEPRERCLWLKLHEALISVCGFKRVGWRRRGNWWRKGWRKSHRVQVAC